MRRSLLSASSRAALFLSAACLFVGLSAPDSARAQYRGFQLNRYEPTAPGEWSFWVDHPWYSKTRYFAIGVTGDYAHNPFLSYQRQADGTLLRGAALIGHQITNHLDIAFSFADRVMVNISTPVTLFERGDTTAASFSASGSPYVSDPRIGFMLRLYGQPYASAFSISAGGHVWFPLRAFTGALPEHASDQQARGIIKLALGGLKRSFMWSMTVGTLIRPNAVLGDSTDPVLMPTASSELQLGVALAYANTNLRFSIGPELLVSTRLNASIFQQSTTSIDALAGFHYNIASTIDIGLAGGMGLLRQLGVADARAFVRLAYAPIRKPETRTVQRKDPARPNPPRTGPVAGDRDRDGVADALDRCPNEPGGENPDPEMPGCPQQDRDGDGILDRADACPEQAAGQRPDPSRPGCPGLDTDGDGILDSDDACPGEAAGDKPDPSRRGCPAADRDNDGVLDSEDRCPDQPARPTADPRRPGCPAPDRDNDGIYDFEDLCPDQAVGGNPHVSRRGCPAEDRDRDMVPDDTDSCPDQPGAPDANTRRNGCPNKIIGISAGKIVVKLPILFKGNSATIAPQSFLPLKAVANVLRDLPQIKKIRVEGHTDNVGASASNMALSHLRAESVVRWLDEHGVDASRATAEGFGDTRPIAGNATPRGRLKNRRIEFVIVDPQQ